MSTPEPLNPEEDLSQELRKQEREIHGNLFMLNKLFTLCCDQSLPLAEVHKRGEPILDKIKETNPQIVKEIEALFIRGDRQALEEYFEHEKQVLIEVLSDEMKHHGEINRKINENKTGELPTDS